MPDYYRARMVKNGPWVALAVWYSAPCDPLTGELLDRSWRWQASVNGREHPARWHATDRADGQQFLASLGLRNIETINQAEYDYLAANHRWAVENDPLAPAAAPRTAIDPLTAPIPF